MSYSQGDIEHIARKLDPHAWDTHDRFINWEKRTGHVMPVDAIDHITSKSRHKAYVALEAFGAQRATEEAS